MITTLLIVMALQLGYIFLTPLVLLTSGWESLLSGISGFTEGIQPYIMTIGNFVELSTMMTCLGVILGVEILIRVWEVISTFIFRK